MLRLFNRFKSVTGRLAAGTAADYVIISIILRLEVAAFTEYTFCMLSRSRTDARRYPAARLDESRDRHNSYFGRLQHFLG